MFNTKHLMMIFTFILGILSFSMPLSTNAQSNANQQNSISGRTESSNEGKRPQVLQQKTLIVNNISLLRDHVYLERYLDQLIDRNTLNSWMLKEIHNSSLKYELTTQKERVLLSSFRRDFKNLAIDGNDVTAESLSRSAVIEQRLPTLIPQKNQQ